MLVEGAMIVTWLGAGATVGSLLTYRLFNSLGGREKSERLKACTVENEALSRTNLIYRERIEQLEGTLFSNEKFMDMAREIDFLRSSNFKLRSKLRDLECLVEAEKKKVSREKVERLEKTVRELRNKMEANAEHTEEKAPLEIITTQREIAVANEKISADEKPRIKQGGWSTIMRAKRIN